MRGSYQWTLQQFLRAHRSHQRSAARLVMGIVRWLVGCLCLGIAGIGLVSGSSGKSEPLVMVLFAGLALVLFAMPLINRWILGSQFRRRPDRDVRIEFLLGDGGVETRSDQGEGAVKWESFARAKTGPAGILLYPFAQLFYWFPVEAFASAEEFREACDLISRKVGSTRKLEAGTGRE